MNAYIKALAYYLPEQIVTNKDICNCFPEWTEDKIYQKVGIKERHVCNEKETSLDLAIKASEKLFLENNIDKSSIDYILFCTQSPEYKLPSTSCLLQERLKLRKNIGALDYNLGCSGYVYGLSLAKGLIVGKLAENILLITSETYTKYLHKEDKGNISIFGDAATATLVSTDGFAEINDFEFGTDGSGAENLIIKTGGAKCPNKLNNLSKNDNGQIVSSDNLYMDGANIFSFTLKVVPTMVNELLNKSSFTLNRIDLFIFHQANVFILEYLRKKLKIEKEKFYYDIESYGNTVSNTIPIALCDALKDKTLENKKNIMLAGFGVGLSWAGCILNLKEGLND